MGSLVELARKLRPKIEELAQGLGDTEALSYKELYPEWAEGMECTLGMKLRRHGRLYKVRQTHTAQAGWEPENAVSLFMEINETHEGTIDNPIPYLGNMALVAGKYYTQDGVVYLCVVNTQNPVYHALKDLVGIYVKEVT